MKLSLQLFEILTMLIIAKKMASAVYFCKKLHNAKIVINAFVVLHVAKRSRMRMYF